MRSFLILANVALKLTIAAAFAHDGDAVAALTFVALAPVSSMLIAR